MSRRDGLLIAEQRECLERDGYLLVPSLLDEIVLAPMRARLDELVHQTLVAWDADPAVAAHPKSVKNIIFLTFVTFYEYSGDEGIRRESGITATPRISIIASGCHRPVVPMPAMAG